MPPKSGSTQLLLFSPSLLAAFVMSLSGLPGRRGLGDALRSVCEPSATGFSPPLLFAPQGVRIDWGPVLTAPQHLFCQLVTLFEASAWPPNIFLSSPPHRVILILWISYLPTILAIIHLGAYRNRVSWLPPVLGFYQWAAAALTFPLLSSFLVPRLLPQAQRKPLSKINIEGLVLGLVVGFFVPSYFLLFSTGSRRQEWTLGWQFFPVWVWLVQYAWVWTRTRTRTNGEVETDDASDSNALRLLALLCAGPSFAGHVLVLSNLTHSLTSLLPPNGVHTLPTHSLLQLAHHTLAWDLGITHLSVCMTVIYLGSKEGGVMGSTKRVLVGTLLGGLGVGVGREWWRSEMSAGETGGKED